MAEDRQLSPRFRASEFVDRRTGQLVGPDPQLLAVLELVRALRGRPMRIVSGYRSKSTNTAVGGAKNSQHLLGRAADIPPGHATPNEAIACGASGVGVRDGWAVHVDVRRAPPVVWQY